ncbi:hypothetical protein [Acinetobacter sp. CIP-A165]|nr:hypothetical protein [Acinetobacter sp. CIP-A165]
MNKIPALDLACIADCILANATWRRVCMSIRGGFAMLFDPMTR